ncbi:MAG: bifunctional methylenetetrahydrofolate dehydrogenase/methenyltetrahydrofolate cyclohydrolase FolD [Lachnospiraceae bacterium]|nr:bifunctional methylenetetrahydrofolate dehydrogenase/methenyltetrahydrofolate cyclohydrolase FolD [Lachnospiraceae bacterium]
MSATLIDGKKISAQIKEEVKEEVLQLREKGIVPCLAVIQVGNDPASSVYVRNKRKACEYTGIRFQDDLLPEDTSQEALLDRIQELNEDPQVHGILVQLPLPQGIDEKAVTYAISPAKDVDGFHPVNAGSLFLGEKGFVSCTPAGILQLLKRSGIEIAGKECVVLGRSNIVGKPMAALLLAENGTVTVTHSKTRNLREVTKRADILVVAVGKPRFVDDTFLKEGAVVIDVGIHRNESNQLCGDVDFEKAAPRCSAITPVPGGVGPMTVAMLMKNCAQAAAESVQEEPRNGGR